MMNTDNRRPMVRRFWRGVVHALAIAAFCSLTVLASISGHIAQPDRWTYNASKGAILALTRAGSHVVLFADCYRRTRQFVVEFLSRFGVEHTLVPPADLGALEAALRKETRLVVSETPTNPYQTVVDLPALAKIAREARVKTLIDSTFATPVNLAKEVLAQLRQHGKVTRGYLGVAVAPVPPDVAKAAGLDARRGAVVANVVDGSPAAKAGLKPGDVITVFQNTPVEDPHALTRRVGGTPPGTQVTLEIARDGGRRTLNATLAELRDERPRAAPGR